MMFEIFPYRHNWSGNFVIKYGYNTNIYTSTALKEQRRAMRRARNPTVEIKYDILIPYNEVDVFTEITKQNFFLFANEAEQIVVKNPKLSIIRPEQDISNLFMLHNIDNLYLINRERSEARSITEVANDRIIVDERFYYNTDKLYIGFKAVIINISFNYLTCDICSYSITARKIIQ